MKINFKTLIMSCALAGTVLVSCVPDRVDGDGNGLVPPANIDAGFTITQTSPNHYLLKDNTTKYLNSYWNIGGEGFYKGGMEESIFLPDEGEYLIEHQAVGQGGVVASSSSQTINVAVSDANAGNLVQGGKFADAADWAKWTINNTGTGANWTFTSGKATLTATNSAGQGIYQAINVVAGKQYKIDMLASSTSGCRDTWFEVYVGYDAPVQGQDYNGDGTKYRFISTWDGQGTSPFSGKISVVGGSNNDGIFTATQTGVVYLGIRGGGTDMKDGISITNVEFRGVN